MKKFTDSVSSRRSRALRCVICCLLVLTICLSLSVGFGYSKVSFVSEGVSKSFAANVLNFRSNPDTISYAMRKATGDTVVTSRDGKVKVTVPEDIKCRLNGGTILDETPLAYVLYTEKVASYYTPGYDAYSVEYDLRLFALFEDESKYGYAWSDSQDILLEIASDEAVTSCGDNSDPEDRGAVTYDDASQTFRINCNRIFKEDHIFIDYTLGVVATPNEPPVSP